jgi:hypothetical protein
MLQSLRDFGQLIETSVCASKTVASGPGLTTCRPSRPAVFTVSARTRSGVPRTAGGDKFTVKVGVLTGWLSNLP